jgi:two-component system response regulator HydG
MPDLGSRPHEDLEIALASVARAIADSLEVREVWERVVEACRTLVPFDAMAIWRLEPGGGRHVIAALGEAMDRFDGRVFQPADFSPEEDDPPIIVSDTEEWLDPSFPVDRAVIEAGYRSALRVTLTHRGKRIGNVGMVSRERGRFTEEHAHALKVLAELIAVALVHEQLATTLAEETRRTAAAQERAALLEQRVQALAQELETLSPHRALGVSRRWRDVLAQAAKVAPTDTTVLLTGESGTGKEVIARFIHRGSPRKDGPFVALNCAALPEQLLESELFGHDRGAFTGAQAAHAGKIEQAAGGVLFLDEVAEMSPAVQAKFLRVLEEHEYQRLGGTRTLKAEVRVLAATHRDLKAAIAGGTFREDLYYRLAVFDIALPALRERPDDISLLTDAFLEATGRTVGRIAAGISDEARDGLLAYSWPGNVRELRNVIERAVILCEGGLITSEHLPLDIRSASAAFPTASLEGSVSKVLPSAEAAEYELIREALARSNNNKAKAARLLGLTRGQLRSRIEKHGLVSKV